MKSIITDMSAMLLWFLETLKIPKEDLLWYVVWFILSMLVNMVVVMVFSDFFYKLLYERIYMNRFVIFLFCAFYAYMVMYACQKQVNSLIFKMKKCYLFILKNSTNIKTNINYKWFIFGFIISFIIFFFMYMSILNEYSEYFYNNILMIESSSIHWFDMLSFVSEIKILYISRKNVLKSKNANKFDVYHQYSKIMDKLISVGLKNNFDKISEYDDKYKMYNKDFKYRSFLIFYKEFKSFMTYLKLKGKISGHVGLHNMWKDNYMINTYREMQEEYQQWKKWYLYLKSVHESVMAKYKKDDD